MALGCQKLMQLVGLLSFYLLRSDIIRSALNTGLHRSDFTPLAEVYYFDCAGFAYKNIIGLDITMNVALLMHSIKPVGYHTKNQQHISKAQRL